MNLQLTEKVAIVTGSAMVIGRAVALRLVLEGADVAVADIDEKTFNINPIEIERLLQKRRNRIKAILAVHLYGLPCDMDALQRICQKYHLSLIEDCAQAHGAEFKGRKAGGLGDIGCFSLYATKNMTTGEGGMITTNSSELARKTRLIRDHGDTGKYHHIVLGYNYRMSEASAAVGSVQMKKLDRLNEKRRNNAEALSEGIERISDLTPPHVNDDVKHVFCQYVVRVEEDYPMKRDKLAEHLWTMGVQVAVHYPTPVYGQPLYRELGYGKTVCPMAEDVCKRVLSLPVHPLVTEEAITYILDVLKEVS